MARKKKKHKKSEPDLAPWQLRPDQLEQTIAQLEKRPPATIEDYNISGLTRRVYYIEYEKKLGDLDGEDLGCMLGQKFSLPLILPRVLELLCDNIMAAGYYNGHLVAGVMSVPAEFWDAHPDLWREFDAVIRPHKAMLKRKERLSFAQFYGRTR